MGSFDLLSIILLIYNIVMVLYSLLPMNIRQKIINLRFFIDMKIVSGCSFCWTFAQANLFTDIRRVSGKLTATIEVE